jgi:formamidopyrimidine-DNA glycosylase
MPEGPQVAQALRLLRAHLYKNGQYPYLVNVCTASTNFPTVNIADLAPALDKRLLDVFTKGKEYYLIFPHPQSTDANPERMAIRAHHGMKGHWTFEHPATLANVHFRLDFAWDLAIYQQTQIPDLYLYYYNERFGQFEILPSLRSIQDALLRLGSDFLGRNPPVLAQWQLAWGQLTKSRLLRVVLMDQGELCCGIGNYLLAEILYAARLHPDVKISQITPEEVVNLYEIVKTLMHGHADKTLEKVIYKKTVTPEGYEVQHVVRGGRKIWYAPALQLQRP